MDSETGNSVSAQGSYVYRVKAVSPNGVSQWSGCARADTPAAPEPEPASEPDPALLAPSNLIAAIVDDGVSLSWDGPAQDAESVTGYELARGVAPQAGSVSTAEFIATGSASIGWVDSHANEPGLALYSYMVRAPRSAGVMAVVLPVLQHAAGCTAWPLFQKTGTCRHDSVIDTPGR